MAIDPTFSVNDFNKPKMLSTLETYVYNIMMLLFGEPGFYPSIPSIGMNIKQYLYKFEDDINTIEIKSELARQCREFLPEIVSGDLDVTVKTLNDRPILIFQLPIIDDVAKYSVALGVTTNKNGEMIYKFVENKYQIL